MMILYFYLDISLSLSLSHGFHFTCSWTDDNNKLKASTHVYENTGINDQLDTSLSNQGFDTQIKYDEVMFFIFDLLKC